MSSKTHQSIRLFKNPVLEALTKVHPSIPFIIWIPVVIYYFIQSRVAAGLDFSSIFFYAVFGALFWSLGEYCMHRFAFHYQATSRAGKYLVYLFHGNHHDDPNDPNRLVFPPVVSLAFGVGMFYVFRAWFGPAGMAAFAGLMVGYLAYDYIHFSVHHFKPRTQWGRTLKENHMKHHFLPHGAKWGVSSPLWDHIFRTFE